jgi:uncharacterized coiled-coil protein SlyX
MKNRVQRVQEIDPARSPDFGLIAEDVATVNPDLVARDEEGKIVTVRYQAVNAMLLNEFLKEHRKVEEQEKTIAELKSGMTALAATVKEQAAQIQKVSAWLEASKPAPQVVNNPLKQPSRYGLDQLHPRPTDSVPLLAHKIRE